MGLHMATENWQRWCGREQRVPRSSNGNRKSSITDGWQPCTANRRRDLIPSRDRRAGRVHRQSMRYSVPYVPLQHLKARTTSLYGIRSRAFSQFRLNLADEGAEWCGRTWTIKTPAEQWSLSLIGVAWVGTTGWRLNRHLHYPGMTVQKTLPTTGERIVRDTDRWILELAQHGKAGEQFLDKSRRWLKTCTYVANRPWVWPAPRARSTAVAPESDEAAVRCGPEHLGLRWIQLTVPVRSRRRCCRPCANFNVMACGRPSTSGTTVASIPWVQSRRRSRPIQWLTVSKAVHKIQQHECG